MAVPFRDGGQGNHWTKVKDAWKGASKQQDTWQREFPLVVCGGPPE
jgi:hypothetical protein